MYKLTYSFMLERTNAMLREAKGACVCAHVHMIENEGTLICVWT